MEKGKPRADILVVEDDPAILRGLADVLVFNGYRVRGVEDGVEGLEAALEGSFDLIVLDVMLPSLDGFSICREIRRKMPGQAVVMLTAKGAEDDIVEGFRAGADDYVSKPFSLRELMVRVEALLRRTGKVLERQRLEFSEIVFDGDTLTASAKGETVELTRREMEIVAYLHIRRDRIVSKGGLTEGWNYASPDMETRTVEIHVQKLRRKIASLIGDETSIRTVRGEGYLLELR